MWGMAKVGGIAALRLFHSIRSATQRVLQLDPVAAFLGRGIVQDDGAPLVVQRFPGGAAGRQALRGPVMGAAAASRMAAMSVIRSVAWTVRKHTEERKALAGRASLGCRATKGATRMFCGCGRSSVVLGRLRHARDAEPISTTGPTPCAWLQAACGNA
jgi:hypothetical protein